MRISAWWVFLNAGCLALCLPSGVSACAGYRVEGPGRVVEFRGSGVVFERLGGADARPVLTFAGTGDAMRVVLGRVWMSHRVPLEQTVRRRGDTFVRRGRVLARLDQGMLRVGAEVFSVTVTASEPDGYRVTVSRGDGLLLESTVDALRAGCAAPEIRARLLFYLVVSFMER